MRALQFRYSTPRKSKGTNRREGGKVNRDKPRERGSSAAVRFQIVVKMLETADAKVKDKTIPYQPNQG